MLPWLSLYSYACSSTSQKKTSYIMVREPRYINAPDYVNQLPNNNTLLTIMILHHSTYSNLHVISRYS